jgi:hypothetical protein
MIRMPSRSQSGHGDGSDASRIDRSVSKMPLQLWQ